ncbi:hypothetical protein ACRRTK_018574 [Alexandromys fortis]
MTLFVFLAILCLGVATAAPSSDHSLDSEWQEWKIKYGKNYSLEEEGQRRTVWEENKKMVLQHNMEYNQGKKGFTMEMNAFGDMTGEEFRKMMTDIPVQTLRKRRSIQQRRVSYVPKFVDWRRRGYVTPVKTQGRCNSCWAFSVAGAIEGQMFWKTGRLASLSPQNLVDCSRPEGNLGCYKGNTYYALEYVQYNGGLEAEATYPYEARDREGEKGAVLENNMRMTKMLHEESDQGKYSFTIGMNFFGDMTGEEFWKIITHPQVPYPRKVKRIQKHMIGDIPKEKLCKLCAVSGGQKRLSLLPVYLLKEGECRDCPERSAVTVTDHMILLRKEVVLISVGGTRGPTSVDTDAAHLSFRFYKEGKGHFSEEGIEVKGCKEVSYMTEKEIIGSSYVYPKALGWIVTQERWIVLAQGFLSC